MFAKDSNASQALLEHSYLGDDLEELHGRTIIEEGTEAVISIIPLPDLVVFPGHLVPLHISRPIHCDVLQRAYSSDRTFGVVTAHWSPGDDYVYSQVGTIVQMIATKRNRTHSGGFIVKVIGQQRFRALQPITPDRMAAVRVLVLPDSALSHDSLRPVQNRHYDGQLLFCSSPWLQCTCPTRLIKQSTTLPEQPHCDQSTCGDDVTQPNLDLSVYSCVCYRKKPTRLHCSHLTRWPDWVFRGFDAQFWMDCVLLNAAKWGMNPTLYSRLDPTRFSFTVANFLPFDTITRVGLLSMDNTVARLRYLLDKLTRTGEFCCANCGSHVCDLRDIFTLGAGPMSSFVNPHGHVHETLTVRQADGLQLIGSAQTESSWFPGYAWTIATCEQCGHHLGWKFTDCERRSSSTDRPEQFVGLSRRALQSRLASADERRTRPDAAATPGQGQIVSPESDFVERDLFQPALSLQFFDHFDDSLVPGAS